jgi:hypothetical protein
MNINQFNDIIAKNLVFPEISNLQQRGIADKIEDQCNQIIMSNFANVTPARSRRSTEDITIGNTFIDHKTSDESLNFKMPNLISIHKLRRLKNDLVYNFVVYNSQTKVIVKTFALNLYELNWDHLHIQNLGAGQLQIKNMKNFLKSPRTTLNETEWKFRLNTEVLSFYENLIKKTNKRYQEWKLRK